MTDIEFSPIFHSLFQPARFKVSDGGRGGGRSWAFSRALIIKAVLKTTRILCAREYQNSIRDSVHRLISDQVEAMGFSSIFEIARESIRCTKTGSEFIFKGLHHNVSEIKSMEGIDICWTEEAERVSEESWSFLIPTIRKPDSEVWITFNPYKESDPTYQRFIVQPPPGTVRMRAGWRENPWFPEILRMEMEHDKKTNIDRYNWIWEGQPLGISDAQVYKGRFEVFDFTSNEGEKLLLGADWGFSQDPTTLLCGFIRDKNLYIEYEAYGVGVDIDDTPELFRSIPDADKWPIWADCARPETISFMQKHGWQNVKPVDKWPGSVEDGISYVKSFYKIIVHPRCRHTIEELELYRYKQDRQTSEILPILVDKDNHCMDSMRYMLNAYIRKRSIIFT